MYSPRVYTYTFRTSLMVSRPRPFALFRHNYAGPSPLLYTTKLVDERTRGNISEQIACRDLENIIHTHTHTHTRSFIKQNTLLPPIHTHFHCISFFVSLSLSPNIIRNTSFSPDYEGRVYKARVEDATSFYSNIYFVSNESR